MPENVGEIHPEERFTRYILNKNYFSREKREVKYAAFMPPRDLKLSVFRTSSIDDARIWDIGNNIVATPQGRTIKGRSDLEVRDVLEEGLRVEPFTEHHDLHAHVIGWPNKESEQRLFATKLALKATLILPV